MNEYTSINGGGFQVPNPTYDDILLRQGYGGQDGVAAQCNLLPLESSSLVSCVSIKDIRHVHYDAILLRQGYGGQDGNVIALTNSTGNISARYRYSPFGELISTQDLDSSGWNERNLHRFSTKPEVAGTGLLYYGYRWYDPATGRWPSRDPIEEVGGMNLYGFFVNDSFNLLDPWGMSFRGSVCKFAPGAFTGAISGALTGAAVGFVVSGFNPAGAVAGAIAGSIAGEVAGGVSAVVSGATNNNGDYSLGGSALSGTVSAGLAGLTEGAMGAGAGIGSTGSLGAVGGGLNDVIGNPNSSLLSVTYSATIGGALGMIGGMEAGLTPLESGLLGAGTTLICEDISAYPNAFSDECPYSILLDNVH